MGSWGYQALDSDQALDWLGNHVTDHVGREIEDLLDQFNRSCDINVNGAVESLAHDLRAAAFVVKALNYFTQFETQQPDGSYVGLHERLADALAIVRQNDAWLKMWDDNGAGVRSSLDQQIAGLREGPHGTTLFENLEREAAE